jgi:hypothetical protein
MLNMGKLVGVVVLVAALSGCSAAAVESAPSTAVAEVAPEATSAPVLTAEPTPVEAEFLTATRRIVGLEDVTLADALPVADYVCGQLDAGVAPLDIAAVKGNVESNDEMIMVSALTICTDHQAAVQEAVTAKRLAASEG